MKLFTAIAFLLFAAAVAQDPAQQQCIRLVARLTSGTCPQAPVDCRHPCTGEVPDDVENCTVSYCCLVNGVCSLRVPRSTATTSVNVNTASVAFANQLNNANRMDRDNATNARFGSVNPLAQGYCPVFPHNCPVPLPVGPQLNYNAPINIPYCHRIACQPSNPFLDSNFQRCVSQPGCYFDQQLFGYRNLVGQAILPGVPVCHLVIRNRAFHRRAAQVVRQLGSWNPFLTQCLIREYRDEILGNAVGCQLLDYLEYFGHTPKRAGWTGINARDCALIGACWRTRTTGNYCAYPSNSQGRPTLRSSNDAQSGRGRSANLYGLPVCYPLNANAPASQFLAGYHTCLASGCAANVDRETLWNHLISMGSSLPFPLNLQYINMVHSGQARPDTYQSILQNLMNRPQFPFGGRPTVYPPPITLPHIPYNLNLRNGSRSFQWGLGGAGAGAGASAGAGGAGANAALLASLLASGGAGAGGYSPSGGAGAGRPHPFPVIPGLPRPPVANPCPYNAQQISLYGLPPLSGSFVGCCDRPLCYIPKRDLYTPYSGLSPYLYQWSAWGACSASCGGGLRNRTRSCVVRQSPCGSSLTLRCNPSDLLLQTQTCNDHQCPTYSNWRRWGPCSATCGGGTRTRSRVCRGVGECVGPATESRSCRTGACPTYSNGPWGPCSNTCGRGIRTRRQRCTDGGAYGCPPDTVDQGPCEQFCGTSSVTCNTQTCCWVQTCRQANGRPGHCLRDNRAGTRCTQGFCIFNPNPQCGGHHAG